MKFSIGDKILLKRTGEEGIVIALLSNVMMEVAVNGTHFPVYTDEVDHPYLKWFTERKAMPKARVQELPVERTRDRPLRLAQGIYLSFMPVYVPDTLEDIVSHLRIFLLNETAGPIHYRYEARAAGGQQVFHHQGGLHAFGNHYLHSLTLEAMNEQPRFNWVMGEHAGVLSESLNKGTVRIKPQRLFEQIMTIQHSGAPAFTYLLADEAASLRKSPVTLPSAPAALPSAPQQAPPAWQPKEVLDLHIEMLRDDIEGLTPAAILQIQTDTLHDQLELAIAHGQKDMVIIHGLGSGVLRDVVHAALSGNPGVEHFRNEWNGRYGYGATVVVFR